MTETEQLQQEIRDYSLVGEESGLSVERGLANATWYTSPVPKEKMRELQVRRNGPAIWDTLLWFGFIFGSAFLVIWLWGTWWFLLPYFVYTVLYATTSDSRWHESSHGTAFKSGWMNNTLYEIASFMVFRQSIVWRWSHTRHHSDTLVRGRDPEIAAPRPPDIRKIILNMFALKSAPAELRKMIIHATGRIDKEVATFLPESEYRKVFWNARIYLSIFALAIAASFVFSTLLPVLFIGLPTLVGTWLMRVYGLTQHAGLAENVLDHRLNCRTVYMNRVHRYLYWNMNYHVEHHMFPMVPYHALPKLHELIKSDCPVPYRNIVEAYREIIPTLRKQVKDPSYFAERKIPEGSGNQVEPDRIYKASTSDANGEGLVLICRVDDLAANDVLRFDLDDQTFAVYHTDSDHFYITEGICTHGNTHLSEGMLVGDLIECPKHNGRFNIEDGSPRRQPVCEALKSYGAVIKDNRLYFDISLLSGAIDTDPVYEFRVISNQNVATFIKELVLEPVEDNSEFKYQPGDYLKLEIPAHRTGFGSFDIEDPFKKGWKEVNAFRHYSFNTIKAKRNYSFASNPERDSELRFNVRISLPPMGVNCYAGVGSTYVFNLKPGDLVKATGPFGEFHINNSDKEMVYVGGGAGMAPLRSHLSWLFDSQKTKRQVSYWYGARSKGEIYYSDYLEELAGKNDNFSFHVALSEPKESDRWDSHRGFIHEVLNRESLAGQDNAKDKEYYLCGPPEMIAAVREVLSKYGVPDENVRFDEF